MNNIQDYYYFHFFYPLCILIHIVLNADLLLNSKVMQHDYSYLTNAAIETTIGLSLI